MSRSGTFRTVSARLAQVPLKRCSVCRAISSQLILTAGRMQPVGKWVLGIPPPKKSDAPAAALHEALSKFVESAWKFVVFTLLTCFSANALRSEAFWRDTPLFWTECSTLPCAYTPPAAQLMAYAVDMAFYMYAIPCALLFETRRKDFQMMTVHHVITVALIGYSYALGYTKVGVTIMFLHDVCDPLLEVAKLAKYAQLEAVTNTMFVLFMTAWVAMRVVYFPFWVVRSVLFELPQVFASGVLPVSWYIFAGMLLSLCVMHVVWTFMIFKVAVNVLTQGEADDVRESSDSEAEERSSA